MRAVRTGWMGALAVAGSVFAGTAASAATISFKLTNGSTTMAASDQAGAPGVRTGNYNNVPVTSNTAPASLAAGSVKDNSGAIQSAVTFTLTPATGQNNGVAAGVSGTNDAALYSNFFDQFATPASTITVTNIPYTTYDVYFYRLSTEGGAVNNAGRAGQFTIGSTSYYVRGGIANPDNTGAGYVLSTDTDLSDGAANTQQGNFVRFTNLTGSTLNASIGGFLAGDTIARNKVAGFQIVEVPEPASLGLLGGGLLLLMRRRERRA